MPSSIVHLPNGQTLTVTPVFGGLGFKANDMQKHHNVFPPGWTIIINSEDDEDDHPSPSSAAHTQTAAKDAEPLPKRHHVHRFRKPSLKNDHLFISSISNPSSEEYKPATSQTRQIAMMLWATLWWYFHQPEPDPRLTTAASVNTPDEGKPKGEWGVSINREGVFKGRHLLPKLERMGLIMSEDSSVGLDPEDGLGNTGNGWMKMFVTRKVFWQLDPRIYLFTLSPTRGTSPFPSTSPASSRPASPNRGATANLSSVARAAPDDAVAGLATPPLPTGAQPPSLLSRHNTPPGPFGSSSHLPTFYPPPPLQYTFTNNTRHPIRPKPFRQGETFYTRYIPSLGQYLSFRVASLSKNPCIYRGPLSTTSTTTTSDIRVPRSDQSVPTTVAAMNLNDNSASSNGAEDTTNMTDPELLHKWMNNPRVSHSWGEGGPIQHQTSFLSLNLSARHSFPAIGCFDGKPFGYFEIYWVKEDKLASYLGHGNTPGDWDRGIHCLVGEEEFRGRKRVAVWLSALVHYAWLADMRTQAVFMEPRVDNVK